MVQGRTTAFRNDNEMSVFTLNSIGFWSIFALFQCVLVFLSEIKKKGAIKDEIEEQKGARKEIGIEKGKVNGKNKGNGWIICSEPIFKDCRAK